MKIQKCHVVVGGVVLVVVVVVVVVVAVSTSGSSQASSSILTLPDHLDASRCPREYGSPRPVVIVSMDGFRPDYLDHHRTPILTRLSKLGVFAPHLLPIYPTKTFPNHYSIVTGLYPESHGIVDNVFFDPTFRALFTITSPPATNGSWWGGEPIWNTLTRQGKKSATFFWPGSEADIGERHPTEWFPFNTSITFSERVNQVLKWVTLPAEERPSWVSLYMEEPDKEGHITGPESSEVDKKLMGVEMAVKQLLEGLAEKELLHCINLLFVSDHGMAKTRADGHLDLTESISNISQIADVIYGPSPKLLMKNPNHEVEVDIVTRLSKDFKGKLRAFLRTDLPNRLHYTNSLRIGPIVLNLQPGYMVKDVRPNAKKRQYPEGMHGYDYIYQDMDAIFIGYGPDLVQGKQVEPFQNIEIYNLMCLLTGVEPAPNNGTRGALHHLLANPPPLQDSTQLVDPISIEHEIQSNIYQVAEGCLGNPTRSGKTHQQTEVNTNGSLPWGPPTTSGKMVTPVLLPHTNHATGYSRELKVPLWTSFTIHFDSLPDAPAHAYPWLVDPRLPSAATPSCTDYNVHNNLTMMPLFPPYYGSPEALEETYFISNAVGVTEQGKDRWQYLIKKLLKDWARLHGPLNVVLGSVFDYDDDGLLDDLTSVGSPSIPPSDLFAVVTRCLDKVTFLKNCDVTKLDAIAFIYPQTEYSWTPDSGNDTTFALQYSARVRDVELLTDLTLFTHLPAYARLSLVLRTHRSLWTLP